MTLPDRFASRLDRLEILITPIGCSVCRHWTPHVLVYEDVLGNQTRDRPVSCPQCGRSLPYEHIVVLQDLEPGDL